MDTIKRPHTGDWVTISVLMLMATSMILIYYELPSYCILPMFGLVLFFLRQLWKEEDL